MREMSGRKAEELEKAEITVLITVDNVVVE